MLHNKIISNQTICKLLKYNTVDALDKPNLTHNERINLLYDSNVENRRIFPHQHINVISDDALTLISIIPTYDNFSNTTVRISYALFVSCQENIFQISGGFRTIRILSELYSMLHNQNLLRDGDKIGYRIEFESAIPYTFNDRYYGFEIRFAATEFKLGCP